MPNSIILSPEEIRLFRADLLAWYARHKRDLPWRKTRDPYAIWISEVMLQQTRVSAVIPFYERFLQRFPTFAALAVAPEADLLSHWAGLGYYYRARNLQKAAQEMVALDAFPATYEGVLALPGIGEYTAAAVGSIGFGLPHAVVDGNVYRVLSRLVQDSTDIATAGARKHFTGMADQLLFPTDPGTYNQALMELGATVCLPKNPHCLCCPVSGVCRARMSGMQNELPVKTKTKKNPEEIRNLFWIERDGSLLLWQRPTTSRLMPGFWELPEAAQLPSAKRTVLRGEFQHGITVHNYRFLVWEADTADPGDCIWLKSTDLLALPLSTVVRKALKLGTAMAATSSR